MLAAITLTILAGCGSTLKDEEKGAIINLYIASEINDFDPALAYTDDASAKWLGLIYEGLTKINEKGKVENALMKSYKIIENPDKNEYRMEITLKKTKWSDGREVAADDVVFAWKRILDPEFTCAASSLLFDIKNARTVKSGDASIDDLGIAAVDTDVVEVQFEGKIDYDRFLENLACLALVPLREDIVVRYDSFASNVATMCSNGPFAVKGMEPGKSLTVERNVYYYRDTDNEDALDKYVLPYRFVINFKADEEENTAMYENGEIFYLGEIALSARADYAKKAKITDLLSTHSVIFNTEHRVLKYKDNRVALSKAIDREALVDIVTFAKPATGLVPSKVYDKKVGDSFRKNGGDLIATTADAAGAKSLASKAGKFTLICRDNALEVAVAEYLKEAWEEIGFTVTVKPLGYKAYRRAYENGDYDAITLDYQCLSTDSFSALSVFATEFSGNGIDIQNDNYDVIPYIPGFDNKEYNALIEAAFAETDRAARSEHLHAAEELLMAEMPIVPLFFNQDAYVYDSSVLSKIGNSYFGYRNFNRLTMKSWRDYLPSAEDE